MNVIKLGLISAVVFYGILWAFTWILPNSTIVSRAVNSAVNPDSLALVLKNQASLKDVLLGKSSNASVRFTERSYYYDDQKITHRENNSDTIFFQVDNLTKATLKGGIAMYRISTDSTAVQLFYVFRAKWYKPWEKFKMMYNDKAVGTLMDSALERLPK